MSELLSSPRAVVLLLALGAPTVGCGGISEKAVDSGATAAGPNTPGGNGASGAGNGGAGNGGAGVAGRAAGGSGAGRGSGGTGGTAGSGGDGVGGARASGRQLIRVVADAPWFGTQRAWGMAVSEDDHVYLADYDYVWEFTGSAFVQRLAATDAASVLDQGFGMSFIDFDLGPDGAVFALLSRGIVRSQKDGLDVLPFGSYAPTTSQGRLGVIDADRVVVTDNDGLSVVSEDDSRSVYSADEMDGGHNCATEELAVAPSGVFLYQPGCNGYALWRGNVDGSGVGLLYDAQQAPVDALNFLCAARDPRGGFEILVEANSRDSSSDHSRLFHVPENPSPDDPATEIVTTPTFAEAKADGALRFRFCSLAVGGDGTVWIQSFNELWKVTSQSAD